MVRSLFASPARLCCLQWLYQHPNLHERDTTTIASTGREGACRQYLGLLPQHWPYSRKSAFVRYSGNDMQLQPVRIVNNVEIQIVNPRRLHYKHTVQSGIPNS